MKPRVQKQGGFSLIELLIVVAIILIIAAIAIPNLLRARYSAQESSAVGTVKAIAAAEATYLASYPGCGYVGLAALGGDGSGPDKPGILDNVFPVRESYQFTITPGGTSGSCGISPSGATYSIQASPVTSASYLRYFYSDESGVIRYRFGGVAGPNDPVIQ